ncbi:MAG: acyltransferase [Akkermansia sp.]|nr:acyltransferase [Akkermansia sp.]
MLVKLKIAVWKVLGFIDMLPLKWKGVRFGKGCFVDGKPYVRMAKGSKIILGDDVTLISRMQHNPMLRHRMAIHTLTPEAEIELHDHAGLSGCTLVCCAGISVGEYTIIGPDTLISDTDGHHYSPETGWRIRTAYTGSPISIGKKCFVGARCVILSGASIGDRCVVAAGTVLNRDVPAGHMASGNPAVITPLPKILGGPGKKASLANAAPASR